MTPGQRLRVLEISAKEEAAAYCGKLFRRAGHDVLRIEPPGHEAPLHLDVYLNGGKKRQRLDLRAERGRLSRLAAAADLLLTDYGPRELGDLGLLDLDGPAVRVLITPFGRNGPYREYEATAHTLLALGGYTWLMGDPDRAPLTMPGNYPYYQAGTFAYIGALAATMASEPGRPLDIDVSVFECLAGLHQFTDTMWNFGGQVRSRHGNRWENLSPTTLYRCHDGWYGVNILANFWSSFALMIGRADLAEDGPLASNAGRMEHNDEVDEIVTKALWDKRARDIFKEGQEVWRVPVGYAAALSDLLADPHLNARSFWQPVEVALPEGRRRLLAPGRPFKFVGEQPPPELPPEPPGEAGFDEDRQDGRPQPRGAASPARPLSGVRVLDLTRIWSGPLATRILGDLGAEVIKIEAQDGRGGQGAPRSNVAAGGTAPAERHWNQQPLFNKLNRNKKSIAIDLKSARGRELFLDLVEKCDVVVENFSARAMPGLGLSYEVMKARNARIIYLSMPAFGQFGPYRDYIGLGPSIEPITGMTALMGYSDHEPRVTSKAVTDPIAGVSTAAAIIEALVRRERTGQGCLIDLSQHETGVAYLGEYFIERQLTGREPSRAGNTHREFAPHGVYRCAGEDDWIAIAARDGDEWRALCEVLGLESLVADQRFATIAGRRENREPLDSYIDAATSKWHKRDLEAALQARGVPAGSVLSAPEWLSDPHLLARGYFVELTHKEAGTHPWDGSPLMFNGARGYESWSPAPCLGEHAPEVLKDILGMSDAEIADLFAQGILADTPPARVAAV
ncbi:MAG TPA: CoA transferase [Dehalococcoidia bacterium]|nr:CoA transferase [Dehalococcoidia bacterium]